MGVRKLKKAIMVLALLILLTACASNVGKIVNGYTDFGGLRIPQFKLPKVGEEIAIITTNKGEIKVKLLDEVAPIAVEHFKKWVKEEKYTDSIFANISKDKNIMIQGSGYKPNMTEEERNNYYLDIVNTMSFDDDYVLETSTEYLHFSGAVSFANYNDKELGYTNKPVGTFFIVANSGIDDVTIELMEEMSEKFGFTKDIIKAYRHIGGVLDYDGNYVVFGQVFYGMELVYEINEMTVDNSRYPIDDPVRIEKIEIVKYDGK